MKKKLIESINDNVDCKLSGFRQFIGNFYDLIVYGIVGKQVMDG